MIFGFTAPIRRRPAVFSHLRWLGSADSETVDSPPGDLLLWGVARTRLRRWATIRGQIMMTQLHDAVTEKREKK